MSPKLKCFTKYINDISEQLIRGRLIKSASYNEEKLMKTIRENIQKPTTYLNKNILSNEKCGNKSQGITFFFNKNHIFRMKVM